MKALHRTFLQALVLFVFFGGHKAAAFPQGPHSNHALLVNLVKEADEILVFKRDESVSGGWRKRPTLDLKAAKDSKLFRALREAEVNKPEGLRASECAWRFAFLQKAKPSKTLGEAFSDGKKLDKKGDASIILPADWVGKLK